MIELIPFTSAHFETLAGWFANEREAVQWAGPTVSFPVDRNQLNAMLVETQLQPPNRLAWMAEAQDRVIGHAQLGIDWRNGNVCLSRVAIAPDLRGRGFAEDMLRKVVDQAFALPAIERVELNVFSFNVAAIRTYEKLGFIKEGMRRSSARVGDERWDTVIMGLLRGEHAH